jgi:hypothetical protein
VLCGALNGNELGTSVMMHFQRTSKGESNFLTPLGYCKLNNCLQINRYLVVAVAGN